MAGSRRPGRGLSLQAAGGNGYRVIYGLGPRAQRVYDVLRGRITSGELTSGSQLPSYVALAEQFGVAPLTMRQVLARLEEEGLVSREQGRGTYVRTPARPAVRRAHL